MGFLTDYPPPSLRGFIINGVIVSDNKIELSGIFSEGYGVVPKKLMRAKDIKGNTKLILCYLLSYTGAGMTCFPQIRNIADDLGMSTRTVIRCIKEAVENKYIIRHQENKGGTIGKKNIYELLFMGEFASAKKSPAKQQARDINGKKHVTRGTRNNNSINNNIYTIYNEYLYKYYTKNEVCNTYYDKKKMCIHLGGVFKTVFNNQETTFFYAMNLLLKQERAYLVKYSGITYDIWHKHRKAAEDDISYWNKVTPPKKYDYKTGEFIDA